MTYIDVYSCIAIVYVGTPPLGSFEGHFFTPSATTRRTARRFQISVQPYCSGQIVPVFEDRFFRTGISYHSHFKLFIHLYGVVVFIISLVMFCFKIVVIFGMTVRLSLLCVYKYVWLPKLYSIMLIKPESHACNPRFWIYGMC